MVCRIWSIVHSFLCFHEKTISCHENVNSYCFSFSFAYVSLYWRRKKGPASLNSFISKWGHRGISHAFRVSKKLRNQKDIYVLYTTRKWISFSLLLRQSSNFDVLSLFLCISRCCPFYMQFSWTYSRSICFSQPLVIQLWRETETKWCQKQ